MVQVQEMVVPRQLTMPGGQWIGFRYSEEASLPGLTNHLGALQAEADPVAVKHVIFPPVSSAEETTGMTTLDGQLLASCGVEVQVRWQPHALERRMEYGDWRLQTRTAIVPGAWAVVIEFELTNLAARQRTAGLRLRLSGRCRNNGADDYLWKVPAVSTHVTTLNRPEGLDVVERFDPELAAACFHNRSESCASLQGVVGLPSRWEQRRVVLNPEIAPGGSVRGYVLLTYGQQFDEAQALYRELAPRVETLIEQAKEYWQRQWLDAQKRVPLPEADLSEPLQRLYANALVTALYLRRDYPNRVGAGKLYLTLFPRRGEGSFYLWDTGMAAPFLARMDSAGVRAMVETAAAGLDLYAQQAMNAFTGKGGGWYYAASPWSLFRMIWGVLCATRDLDWLDRPLRGIRQGQCVLDLLEELALVWTTATPGQAPLVTRTRPHAQASAAAAANGGAPDVSDNPLLKSTMPAIAPGAKFPFAVADTGDRGTQLEANTTYEHQVASVNAGSVWMMRRLAELHEHRGNITRAEQLRHLADGLAAQVLRMFRHEDGFFACGKPDGTIFESRVVLDHFMVMLCMTEDLSPHLCQTLVESFQRELRTPAWMRCVSEHDPDVVSGYRSDTAWCGSYPGFVALMAEGLCQIGRRVLALQWLEQVAAVTAQGPFGQSYWVEGLREPVHGGPAKSTDEMPQGTHWCEMGGVAFGGTILHGVLGLLWSPFEETECTLE